MLLSLLLAGLTFRPVPLPEPVLDVRVVDIDADGREDIVAVTRKHLVLLRGGRGPPVLHAAPPLTVVGHGLLGIVQDGRYRPVKDPFGAFTVGKPSSASLLAMLGRGEPALLRSPGDLDGDGKDDPVLAGRKGFVTPAGLVPVTPHATLAIRRNEAFAVRYEIPVPVTGNWSGKKRELVFLHDDTVLSFSGTKETDRVRLPLKGARKEPGSFRRNHVYVRDIDGNGRLDLLVLIAKGSTGVLAGFEATARLWLNGHVLHEKTERFHRPVSFLKVDGALLRPALVDLDRDGDLDLVLSTVMPSIFQKGSGNYYLFRFNGKGFVRKPAWTHRGPIPMSVFTDNPQPPVTFLPDLDGDHEPEAILVGAKTVRLLQPGKDGRFVEVKETDFAGATRPRHGRRMAVLPGAGGLLIVEPER